MSYKEKQSLVSLVTTIIVSIPYLAYIFMRYQSGNYAAGEEVSFWAKAILVLIPLRIVMEIIISIIFSILSAIITRENTTDITDERDNLIELKGMRNSFLVFIIGFLVALISVALNNSVSTMFIIIFITGVVSELSDIFSKLYYYHKGV